eukprot:285190-Rhodomonas_salina.1
MNPEKTQTAVRVQVLGSMTLGQHTSRLATSLATCTAVEAAAAQPMRVVERPKFTRAVVGQANPLASASNTITVTFVSPQVFEFPAKLHISGLRTLFQGAHVPILTQNKNLTISLFGIRQASSSWIPGLATLGLSSDTVTIADMAEWSNGTLTFSILPEQGIQPGKEYSISFNLTNPSSPQTATAISIEVSGKPSIHRAKLGGPSNKTKAMGIEGGQQALRVVEP